MRRRSYELGTWTICDVAAVCLALFIGIGCGGCIPDDLTVVLGGGSPVYTPPIYSPPVYVDPCCGGGGYDGYYDDGYYDDGYYDDGYYDDYVVIDVGVGW